MVSGSMMQKHGLKPIAKVSTAYVGEVGDRCTAYVRMGLEVLRLNSSEDKRVLWQCCVAMAVVVTDNTASQILPVRL